MKYILNKVQNEIEVKDVEDLSYDIISNDINLTTGLQMYKTEAYVIFANDNLNKQLEYNSTFNGIHLFGAFIVAKLGYRKIVSLDDNELFLLASKMIGFDSVNEEMLN